MIATMQFYDYESAVKEGGDRISVLDHWIISGEPRFKKWVLFISCKANQGPELISHVLPLLWQMRYPYRIIRDQRCHFRLNAGALGISEVGKVISIYALNDEDLQYLLSSFPDLLVTYNGPEVYGALQISPLLYVGKTIEVQDESGREYVEFVEPAINELPLRHIPVKRNKRKRILGRYYVPVALISKSAKGEILKAVNMRKFAFSWCLIKQGLAHAVDDLYDREMKHRLLWQKEVLEDLRGVLPVPAVLDYFEDRDAYLVMEFIEGIPLYDKVMEIKGGRSWKMLSGIEQRQLICYLLEIVRLIKVLHKKGYVHRDITDKNCMVKPDGSICLIDFELSYNLKRCNPDPPFVLGTHGYAAPEQLRMEAPSVKEDVYSLAALCVFVISSHLPIEIVTDDPDTNSSRIAHFLEDVSLLSHIVLCLEPRADHRPDILYLEDGLLSCLDTIKY